MDDIKVNGRPTKYTSDEEMEQEVIKYLEECVDEQYTLTKSSSNSGETVENKIRVNLPTLEGFALRLGITTSTLYKWKLEKPNFSESLERIIEEQRKRLLDKGLSGDYNPTIAKLILSSNHGMAEKTQQDITSNGETIGVDNETKAKVDTILDGYLNKGTTE